MSTFMLSPFAAYVLGMVFVVMLVGLFCWSIWYYWTAKDIAPYLEKKKDLKAKIASLVDDRQQLQDALDKLTDQKVHAEEQIAKGKEAEAWLRSKAEQIESTQKNINAANADFENARGQLEDLQRKVSDKQQELIEIEKKMVDAEMKRQEAERGITDLRNENSSLGVTVPALREEKARLEKEIEDLKSAKATLELQCKELAEKINKLNSELAELDGKLAAKRTELAQQQAEAKTLRNEVADLQGRAIEARRFLAERDAARDNEKEKWGSLETPIVADIAIREVAKIGEELAWLDSLNRNLEADGFVFDPRALRAFHTGLKCAEQVPLVVLAGISGTGKSLLPELYSAALGMNFLSVPVQPRWDSPQDLFGFYNYMEGRYKATELARLLWQFDIYNGPAKEKYTEANLPINMVLLDEMNLARVEYYFSDLLSKLETRNGLDSHNALQRAKAEIELECNANDRPRHMFVSTNTLFVGTMNEDESTQMLSDKVIDRSNVLRFGLPKVLVDNVDDTMRQAPDKQSFLNRYEKKGRITAAEWNSWHKKVTVESNNSPALTFLRDTVTPVLESLGAVNRSYGFRVDNAMKAYVLNYPGNYKEAVADQIEMKILPKLNGVELQADGFATVKSAINEAITKTGDDKLQDAFDKTCPENATFFKWRGVMR